jgi:hypothetical protein
MPPSAHDELGTDPPTRNDRLSAERITGGGIHQSDGADTALAFRTS